MTIYGDPQQLQMSDTTWVCSKETSGWTPIYDSIL